MKKQYCPYCGAHLDEGCNCAREAAEYEAEQIEELEERQHASGFYPFQDIMETMRFER